MSWTPCALAMLRASRTRAGALSISYSRKSITPAAATAS
jgi:hypothetical protein